MKGLNVGIICLIGRVCLTSAPMGQNQFWFKRVFLFILT